MSLFGKLFGSAPPPTVDGVTIDVSGYSYQGVHQGARIWHLPAGGGVVIYFFPVQPNLPGRDARVGTVRSFYEHLCAQGNRIVECREQTVDGIRCIHLVMGCASGQGRATTYVGSLTIPFKDFSFVVKTQIQEGGMTGLREAILLDQALADGTATVTDGKLTMHGWHPDDERFDAQFPEHPLTQVRQVMRSITASVRIDPQIRQAPAFAHPNWQPDR